MKSGSSDTREHQIPHPMLRGPAGDRQGTRQASCLGGCPAFTSPVLASADPDSHGGGVPCKAVKQATQTLGFWELREGHGGQQPFSLPGFLAQVISFSVLFQARTAKGRANWRAVQEGKEEGIVLTL